MTRLLVPLGSWFLAGLLAYSAVDKVLHWSLFLNALTMYRAVPALFVPIISYTIPCVEILTALALMVPVFRTSGLHVAAWLLAAFTVMVGYAAMTVPGVPCGCSFSLGPSRATLGHVVLNALLTGLAWALASSSGGRPLRAGPEGVV